MYVSLKSAAHGHDSFRYVSHAPGTAGGASVGKIGYELIVWFDLTLFFRRQLCLRVWCQWISLLLTFPRGVHGLDLWLFGLWVILVDWSLESLFSLGGVVEGQGGSSLGILICISSMLEWTGFHCVVQWRAFQTALGLPRVFKTEWEACHRHPLLKGFLQLREVDHVDLSFELSKALVFEMKPADASYFMIPA